MHGIILKTVRDSFVQEKINQPTFAKSGGNRGGCEGLPEGQGSTAFCRHVRHDVNTGDEAYNHQEDCAKPFCLQEKINL